MANVEAVPIRLRRIIEDAVKEYNRYRSPEATAEILEFRAGLLKVRITGSFCETCGINDWVDDLRYVLEDHGLKVKLVGVIEPDEIFPTAEDWRIGIYKIEGHTGNAIRDDRLAYGDE